MGNLIFLALASLLMISCGKNMPAVLDQGTLPGNNKPFGEIKTYLEGNLEIVDQPNLNLDANFNKPIVMIFSQDTCVVCRGEAKMLSTKFNELHGIPKNIELVTILIGSTIEDAQDFKSELGIQWKIGSQDGDALFRKFCPELKVPCVMAQTPSDGIVFRKLGEVGIEELEKYTGAWIYE